MTERALRTFQALTLVGVGFFLLDKILSGDAFFYINQRSIWGEILAALGLIFLAQWVFQSRPASQAQSEVEMRPIGFKARQLLWLGIPILLGLVFPPAPAGAALVRTRGVNLTAPLNASATAASAALDVPEAQRTVLDWIRVYATTSDPGAFDGAAVDVTGFVFHDVRLAQDQFILVRLAVTCCAADPATAGMVVTWPKSAGLAEDSWVRINGELKSVSLDDQIVPGVIASSVEPLEAPLQPYLYP